MKKTHSLLLTAALILTFSKSSIAGDGSRISREQYIGIHKDDAVKDMKKTGVPASITLAQALLESEDGNSTLAVEANNHFGIKCADWTGPTFNKDDDKANECFRKYGSVLESYDDHSDFLRTRQRYSFLFDLDKTDYKGWAKGLKKAGYATNPEYAERLIKIIEDNRLFELDRGNDISVSEPLASKDVKLHQKKFSLGKVMTPGTDVVDPYSHHSVMKNNDVQYVVAKEMDSYSRIANEFDMSIWQILKYNEISGSTPITEGQKIYIKPKARSNGKHFYFAQDGDDIHSISQEFGVKTRLLYKWNNLAKGTEPKPGQRIWLEKHTE